MKKVLFIDRDGTLIIEPAITEQIDSLELLEFYPHAFQYMARIANELDYELVLVSNQDGLGTDSFPEDTFYPAHQKFIQAFANEGVVFAEELIDRSFPQDNSLYRKPNTGMLTHYIKGDYDLKNSLGSEKNYFLDCITVLSSNILFDISKDKEYIDYEMQGQVEDKIITELKSLIDEINYRGYNLVMITNEVGDSIVPEHHISRVFRDIQGRINQRIAAIADQVYLVCCGIPVKIK